MGFAVRATTGVLCASWSSHPCIGLANWCFWAAAVSVPNPQFGLPLPLLSATWGFRYSSWACTPNCRGFDYWLGYYGAAEDYYLHGSPKGLDFHENYAQAPQYRSEYSTALFTRKAQAWIANATTGNATRQTYLHLAYQAVCALALA